MSINTTYFDFSRWRPSAILDYQKFEILTVCPIWRASMRHHAKWCADRSNRCRNIAILEFCKMAADAILDL